MQKRRRIEDNFQIAVANYLRYKYPKVRFTISPQGMYLPMHIAKRLKAMGYAKGTPDLMIFKRISMSIMTIERYSGLMIELKPMEYGKRKGSLSVEQKEFIRDLRQEGYYADVCYGSNEACDLIDFYLTSCEKLRERKLNYD